MRVKCANCGMIYDVSPTPMDYRSPQEVFAGGTCPGCKSNAKDAWPRERSGYSEQPKSKLKCRTFHVTE